MSYYLQARINPIQCKVTAALHMVYLHGEAYLYYCLSLHHVAVVQDRQATVAVVQLT
jgi:hypothetical protein